MKSITIKYSPNLLFKLVLLDNKDIIGELKIYPHEKEQQAWLDLYIQPLWRKRWLTKSFAKFLYQTVIITCREHKVDLLLTRVNNPLSTRLLDFFPFVKYNEKYYYLII